MSPSLDSTYAPTFCEWVVGRRVSDGLVRPPSKTSGQREIVRVELATNVETDQDTLRITYPRPCNFITSSPTTTRKAAPTKRVRFREPARKPAADTLTAVSCGSDSEPSSDVDADASPRCHPPDNHAISTSCGPEKRGRKTKRSLVGSEAASSPHPACSCDGCQQPRGKTLHHGQPDGQQPTAASWPGPWSHSTPPVSSEPRERHVCNPCQHHDAVDQLVEPPVKHLESARAQGEVRDCNQCSHQPSGSCLGHRLVRPPKSQQAASAKPYKLAKACSKSPSRSRTSKAQERRPETCSEPHPRYTNLPQPARPEVVQAERVMVRPEDPPPNAYFDAAHGIVRIYHEPPIASHGNQASSSMPAPTLSPTRIPRAVPMCYQPPLPYDPGEPPLASWGPTCPPFILSTDYGHSGWAPSHPPESWRNVSAGKGAFSIVGPDGNWPSPHRASSPTVDSENPYYPGPYRSQFSTYGTHPASGGSNLGASMPRPSTTTPRHGPGPRDFSHGPGNKVGQSVADNDADAHDETNNVTAGSWYPSTEAVTDWGDVTMAASTGGAVDEGVW